jgi:hypothetical protein
LAIPSRRLSKCSTPNVMDQEKSCGLSDWPMGSIRAKIQVQIGAMKELSQFEQDTKGHHFV